MNCDTGYPTSRAFRDVGECANNKGRDLIAASVPNNRSESVISVADFS